MLTKAQILELFQKVNKELAARGEIGEIGLVGGAVMCLVYNARAATKDVGAIFEPASILREIAKMIAEREGLSPDWLNDAAKGYILPGFKQEEVLSLSNLRVWAPEARYMLAMKCVSARWDTNDRDDVIFLIQHLQLKTPEEIFSIIEKFYPSNQIPPKTKFFIEKVVRIGVIQSLTGIAAVDGKTILNSLELAKEEINRSAGWKVKLLVEDDKTIPKSTVSAYKKLKAQGIRAIIGPTWDFTSNSILALAAKDGIVIFPTCAPLESIHLEQAKGYGFINYASNSEEVKPFAVFAKKI